MIKETQAKLSVVTLVVVLVSVILLSGCVINTSKKVTYRFSEDVNQNSIDKILNKIDTLGKNDTMNLIITSPGGYLSAFYDFKHTINNSTATLNTEVHNRASSAGALMFLRGKIRTVRENARILFHNVRIIIRDIEITEDVLIKYFKGTITHKDTLALLNKQKKTKLKELLVSFHKTNVKLKAYVTSILGLEVANKILVLGKDVILNAKKAIEYGVANRRI